MNEIRKDMPKYHEWLMQNITSDARLTGYFKLFFLRLKTYLKENELMSHAENKIYSF